MPKLDKFSLFDNFFPDLADFWDLDNFLPFKFFDFLAIFLPPPIPNLLIFSSPIFSHLRVDFSGGIIVFSIEVSRAAILLKFWMNYQ